MRRLLRLAGVLLVVMGTIWTLQGLDVVRGVPLLSESFMMGQTTWVVLGGIAAAAGAGLLLYARRPGTG